MFWGKLVGETLNDGRLEEAWLLRGYARQLEDDTDGMAMGVILRRYVSDIAQETILQKAEKLNAVSSRKVSELQNALAAAAFTQREPDELLAIRITFFSEYAAEVIKH